MNDNIYNPDNKEIRFIDPQYNELFRIPDGGRIVVTRPMGEMYPGVQEQWVGVCKYLDSCHFQVSGETYHCCQFAEIQARIGSVVEPEPKPEMVGNYRVTRRTFVGDKIFKMGHNPNAVQPYGTWQSYKDSPDQKDWGHYWIDRSTANTDFFRRVESERCGTSYDHTKLAEKERNKGGSR